MRTAACFFAAAALAVASVGCMTYHPVPAQSLHGSATEIKAAREIGAAEDPEASVHLQLAQTQLQEAQRLIHSGDNERAEWVLRRARMDAELAVALARENWMRIDAQQAAQNVETVRTAHALR